MIVVTILGILVAIAYASYGVTVRQARRIACLSNQRVLQGAVVQYEAANGSSYPALLSDLSSYVRDVSSVEKCTTPPFAPLAYDHLTGDVSCSTTGHQQL